MGVFRLAVGRARVFEKDDIEVPVVGVPHEGLYNRLGRNSGAINPVDAELPKLQLECSSIERADSVFDDL